MIEEKLYYLNMEQERLSHQKPQHIHTLDLFEEEQLAKHHKKM